MPETPNSFDEWVNAEYPYLHSIVGAQTAESMFRIARNAWNAALATQPPQAAVGEGELPELSDAIYPDDGGLQAILWLGERTDQLRKAIAQRDEARKVNRTLHAATIEMSAKLAALDVPKPDPEKIERWENTLKELRQLDQRPSVLANIRGVEKEIARLRSLPSEPAGKAGEND